MLTTQNRRHLEELAPWLDIAGEVLECLARPSFAGVFDEAHLCREAHLPDTQVAATVGLLRKLVEMGLVAESAGMQWRTTAPPAVFKELAPLVQAVSFYKTRVHRDDTIARVALTRPGQPSKLEAALSAMGFATGRMEVTSEAFGDIAVSAKRHFTVMTPFLDIHGAQWLAELLRQVKADVRKTVIFRYLRDPSHSSYPEGFVTLQPTLSELAVEVLDYAVPRVSGYGTETFHAKVVLADEDYAYVGSANMNRSSLEYSMELGMLVKGEAARTVARVVNAIKAICCQRRPSLD